MGKAEAKGLFKIVWFVIILILTIITIGAAFSGYLHPADSKLMSLLGRLLFPQPAAGTIPKTRRLPSGINSLRKGDFYVCLFTVF